MPRTEYSSSLATRSTPFRYPPLPTTAVLNQLRWCNCNYEGTGLNIAVIKMSQRRETYGRIYFACKNFLDSDHPGCGFFMWVVDEGVATRTGAAINDLQETLEHAIMDTVGASIARLDMKLSSKMDMVMSSSNRLERQVLKEMLEMEKSMKKSLAGEFASNKVIILVLVVAVVLLVLVK